MLLDSGLAAPAYPSIALAAGATGPGLLSAGLALPGFGPLPSAPIAQAGGVPVPPSLAPIYGRESGFNFQAQNPTSTASGAGQDIDSTWREAMRALGYGDKWAHAKDAPPDVQNAANIWLQGRYGNKPWAASEPGHGGVGYDQGKADIRAQEAEINAKIGGLVDKIGALDARDPASLRELAHYREEMEKYQQQALQLATHPPQFNPGQQMQQQGGMALIIGMLGGLLTKRPLIASLNAGAAAMNAYHKGDQETYQRNLDQWKVSTDAMFKMAEFEHQMYSDTLKDEKLSEGEKLDKLRAQAELLGNQRMLLAAQSHDLDAAQHNSLTMENMLMKWQMKMQGGGGIEKSGEYDITTPDGKTKRMSLEQGKQPGTWFSSSTGQRMQFPEGTDVQPITAGAGRQEATQINAMVGSTNEAVGDLKNLMELPSSATAGWFMGVQTERPSDLVEAIRRSFAGYLTDREAKDLLVSAQGIQREIATIEAQGRATGLVGLTNMADTLIPQVNDPGPVVLRKYAQIRQIIERNIETIVSRSNVDQKQKALLEKNLEEIKRSVPFTVHDVNELEKRLDRGDDQSVAEYAKRVFVGAGMGGGALPEGVPAGSKQVGTHDGNPVYEAPDGKRYEVR